ncbi:MAG: pseudouridine synthase [Peptococcaceae bacterium]|nr:pseudouridine synthase [Peptococcaceae bacterium]
MRLQKVLAQAGVASRRHSEELILSGEVKVNGCPVTTLGTRVDPAKDRIEVGGRVIGPRLPKVYLALNKPRGVLTTLSDRFGRRTVRDIVPGAGPGVFPVGRLDYDSEGLLLLTNDGDLAWAVTHPSHLVPKTYLVTVAGRVEAGTAGRLAAGVVLSDGLTAKAQVRIMGPSGPDTVLEITIHEGRKRQIRRMCAQAGHPVKRLVRLSVGPIMLAGLAPGEYRRLEKREVESLLSLVQPLLLERREPIRGNRGDQRLE